MVSKHNGGRYEGWIGSCSIPDPKISIVHRERVTLRFASSICHSAAGQKIENRDATENSGALRGDPCVLGFYMDIAVLVLEGIW